MDGEGENVGAQEAVGCLAGSRPTLQEQNIGKREGGIEKRLTTYSRDPPLATGGTTRYSRFDWPPVEGLHLTVLSLIPVAPRSAQPVSGVPARR
jgi:hypothetical protein